MKNLLVGNGANIQFDSESYTTKQIVLRILKNFERKDFPSHVIAEPKFTLRNYIGVLFLEIQNIIDGKYDLYANNTAEKDSLQSFKEQYQNVEKRFRITDIGFEDYYLVHDLFCHKNGIINPDQFYIREALKLAYIHSIYNDGLLNCLHLKYPKGYVQYLSSFDDIYTTNYDLNIESATGKEVFHIHGQFDILDEAYNKDSFRNQLQDAPINNTIFDDRYLHLYSNVISTHCGAYKSFLVTQNETANEVMAKFAHSYIEDEKQKNTIDSWLASDNKLLYNLGSAIILKTVKPDLCFSEYYHYDRFKNISGSLEILGLSPWNDFHIFDSINNANLDICIYYYFNESEREKISDLLYKLVDRDILQFRSAKAFWKGMYEN